MTIGTNTADTRLEPQRYFDEIDGRTERLLAVAAGRLDDPVPACPGWVVRDVVEHVAMVYEHKVRVMAENAWPRPWPPDDDTLDAPPLERLAAARSHLFAEFARHSLDEQTTTFAETDTTIAFWVRRMALEIAVHVRDAEQAVAVDPLPIPADLGLDGIDEILTVTLAGPWWDGRVDTVYPIDGVVAVEAAGHRWLCTLDATSVRIGASAAEPLASVAGDPADVFLWLWGRVDDETVTRSDAGVITQFRGRLSECTG
jgi:uncharacterized protein (TIGR03083 family)